MPLEVQERFERITGGKLIEGYGLTEASPVTHANNIWEKRKNGSIGIPFPDTLAKIVHPETGEEMLGRRNRRASGQRSPGHERLLEPSRRRPNARCATDGCIPAIWRAWMKKVSFIFSTKRKDMIIAGGYNIYPREVEEVLFEHPDVEEAVVVKRERPVPGRKCKGLHRVAQRFERDGTGAEKLVQGTSCGL